MSVVTSSERRNALIDDDYQKEAERGRGHDDDTTSIADSSSDSSISNATSGFHNGPTKQEQMRPLIKPFSKMILIEKLAFIVAWITIILSFIAMIIEGGKFVVASWIFSMIMGPYLYYQKVTLTNMAIMKETNNSLERDISRLKGENTTFSYNGDELEGRVEDLLDVEEALEIVTNSNGQSEDALEKKMKSNTEIVQQMKQTAHGIVIEVLISLIYQEVLNKNNNNNNIDKIFLSEKDVTKMIQNLNGVKGLFINEYRLRNTLVGNPIGESIFDALQNLLDKEILVKDSIFEVENKQKP
mmetsp:Transcript_46068/g.51365  ORF Transcript_46068/g.51365 Transcript_46068/m.51365 type:complete len:299 (+) Transcript_46068:132-1028(+)